MSTRTQAILFGVGCFLLFAIMQLPANLVWHWLPKENTPLAMQGIHGTIWSGGADECGYNQIQLGAVSWRFQPAGLIRGQLGYRIKFRAPGQQLSGNIALTLTGDTLLENVKGVIKAGIIPLLLDQSYIRATGELDINLPRLLIDSQSISDADGVIRWQNAGAVSPIKVQFGSLLYNIKSDGKAVTAKIQDLDGPLSLKGNLILDPTGAYRLSGEILPKESANPDLVKTLRAIGQADEKGSIRINLSGQL